MSAQFDIAFERLFRNEGEFQDDYNDRGNWTSGTVGAGQLKGTKYGLAAMTYPDLDIKNLTLEDAKAIYKRDWWEVLQMDLFPRAMGYQMFDAAINHGMHNATKMLQRAASATPDGIIGRQTHAAIAATELNDLLMLFLAARLEFMTGIRTWGLYGKGWARRIAHNLQIAAGDN